MCGRGSAWERVNVVGGVHMGTREAIGGRVTKYGRECLWRGGWLCMSSEEWVWQGDCVGGWENVCETKCKVKCGTESV